MWQSSGSSGCIEISPGPELYKFRSTWVMDELKGAWRLVYVRALRNNDTNS